MLLATAACDFSTSELQKVVRACSERHILIENVLLATAACNFSTSQLQSGPRMLCFVHFDLQMCFSLQRRAIFQHRNFKVVRECCVLYILTCKCASRYSGVQFFNIATSKSGPRMLCFVHFDLQMCFSPQPRAIFPHRNFKKWSEPVARGAFLLKMCFSPQRRAIFHVFSQQPPPHPPL